MEQLKLVNGEERVLLTRLYSTYGLSVLEL